MLVLPGKTKAADRVDLPEHVDISNWLAKIARNTDFERCIIFAYPGGEMTSKDHKIKSDFALLCAELKKAGVLPLYLNFDSKKDRKLFDEMGLEIDRPPYPFFIAADRRPARARHHQQLVEAHRPQTEV